jgi:uroporphyrinogen decarboxylase
MDIGQALTQLGPYCAVQGNLDSVQLFAPWDELKSSCERILTTAKSKTSTGYVFNLGHGILQHTPEDKVKRVVELVKSG